MLAFVGLVCLMGACGGSAAHAVGGGEDAAVSTGSEASATDADAEASAEHDASPPSCPSTCGPSASESCCTSLTVTGGTFYRSYDGVSCDTLTQTCFTQQTWPATVSTFRLDRFEVTVGRYRPFAEAIANGWLPAAGAGKHTHLHGGQGLVDSSAVGGIAYESGWDPTWNPALESSVTEPDADHCATMGYAAFPPTPGPDDNQPVACVPWWTAYAFCIWDGGFLPTEAEWNYAASGGSQQRVYPWGAEAIDCTYANYDYCLLGDAGIDWSDSYESVVGAYSPKGDGLFGQADLEGNVSEWALDYWSNYVTPCVDCAFLQVDPAFGTERIQRGAAFDGMLPYVLPVVSERGGRQPQLPLNTGLRCARAP
jgi:formylglycine-generating enzyme required for sulfatase activity